MFGAMYYDPQQERTQTSIHEQLEAFEQLRKAGKMRHIGLSNETPYGVHEFVRLAEQHGLPRIASVQNVYCLVSRALENGLDETMHRLERVAAGVFAAGVRPADRQVRRAAPTARTRRGRPHRQVRIGAQAALGPAESLAAARRYNALARENGLTPTRMALAWCYTNWQVASTIIGVTHAGAARRGPGRLGHDVVARAAGRHRQGSAGRSATRLAEAGMSHLIVHGGTALSGRIVPSANKNAVLPILCATLLTREPVRLLGIPEITDVRKILEIFRQLGSDVRVDYAAGVLDVHHRDTQFDPQRHHLPEEMRSSIMLVPGLLARFGVARIENDVQGCTLGVREIDPHVEVMQRFGADVERGRDMLLMRSEGALRANDHWLDYASVTTTENFVLCAALAGGTSTLMNAASEPHVQEFCEGPRQRNPRHRLPEGERRRLHRAPVRIPRTRRRATQRAGAGIRSLHRGEDAGDGGREGAAADRADARQPQGLDQEPGTPDRRQVGRALQARSGQSPQRLPGGRHLALRHAQGNAGVRGGEHPALPRIVLNGGRRGYLVGIAPKVLVDLLKAKPVNCALAE
jgi:hypothetical protein